MHLRFAQDLSAPMEERTELNHDPRYGYFPWWPEDGNDWVHPDDAAIARRMIPSERIWRREEYRKPYTEVHYGEVRLRVRPTLWVEVSGEGVEVGDWVEVKSKMRLNLPRIGRIGEMFWDPHSREIRYQIEVNQQLVPTTYGRGDLRRIDRLPD